jgi:peptide/nickel transport system ATP-binding protein
MNSPESHNAAQTPPPGATDPKDHTPACDSQAQGVAHPAGQAQGQGAGRADGQPAGWGGGAVLSVEGLRVVLARTGADVVDEVCFELSAGRVLGLVGESGSGKTTVALALLGHARRGLRISAGRVLLDGQEILGLGGALRSLRGRAVSYVAQDPSSALNPALKIGTQLREVLAAHSRALADKDIKQRISQLLADVRLDSVPRVLDVYPHQLSGGQQQRVVLAMAFACRPKLIVLDEPTTGLDVSTQRHVLDTVRELCANYNAAAVYVSHDLAVVGQIADHIGVMYAGRLVEMGPTGQVFAHPAHPYTRGLLRAIPSPARAHILEGLAGQPPRPGMRPAGCFFAPRCQFCQPECKQTQPPPLPLQQNGHWARCLRATQTASLPPLDALPQRQHANPQTQSTLLEIKNLNAAYAQRQILKDINLTVPPGSCMAIVGESGAGKTTLARCIVGLHTRWQGQITLQNKPLPADRRQRDRNSIRMMQYIFQNPYTSLNPRKTIAQLIAQPLQLLHRLPKHQQQQQIRQALTAAALGPEYLNRYPDQLSGGERQRVAIARALVVDPKLLLCDEITSALDVSVQATIVELLHNLQTQQGLTLLLITHNLALVRSLADDIIILQNGQIIEQGPNILDHPQTPYATQLLADAPTLTLT